MRKEREMTKAEKIFTRCLNESVSLIEMHGYEEKTCWHTLWGFAYDKHCPNRTCNDVEKLAQSKLRSIKWDIEHGFVYDHQEQMLQALDIVLNTVNNQRKLNAEI